MWRALATSAAIVSAASSFVQAPGRSVPAACGGADLVVRNGRILTLDGRGAVVPAMAAKSGEIVAVGTVAAVTRCAAPGAVVIDLAGRTAIPGLIDVHTHALEWAKSILRNEVDTTYPAVRSIADIVRLVTARARTTPVGGWILGTGWDDAKLAERRYITRDDLDTASPSHAVYLMHVSGHLGAANGVALARAGITPASADPPGGVIERDSGGRPTGIVKDTAMSLVARQIPPDPPDLAVRAAREVSKRAVETGLTTIHDVNLAGDDLRGYQRAGVEGALKVRLRLVPGVASVADAERLASLGVHTGFGTPRLKLGAVKLFADGGMGARTIAIYEPSVENEPGNLGLLIWKTEDLRRAHRVLAAAGWQIVTHAIGDRAIDQVLDSYEDTIAALKLSDHRFRIAHGGLSTPAVQRRLKALAVGVDGNPAFVYWIGSWFRKYGAGRVRWSYPGRSDVDSGIVLGGASDVPVTPISPWWGIWAGVARRELQSNDVLAPDERLTVAQMLRVYTRNGAWLGFDEALIGALTPGRQADFVVLDRDVLTIPPDDLRNVNVLATYIAGERVHGR